MESFSLTVWCYPNSLTVVSCSVLQVVFSAVQLLWLSAEQAWAVTEEQWAELDAEQRHAVGLARYEGDILMELRGVLLFCFLRKLQPAFLL